MLSEDGVRRHHPHEGDAERDGQDCSLHDLLLVETITDSVRGAGQVNL
jgi:hypothetical protein